jgi:hypothetical protein
MSPLKRSFLRHENANGTIDSVCKSCFATVATATKETELEESERTHVCDPHLMEHWKEVAKRRETKRTAEPAFHPLRYVFVY